MQLHSTLEIVRPADEVFAVISDFSRHPEWQGGMRSAAWTSELPVAVGSIAVTRKVEPIDEGRGRMTADIGRRPGGFFDLLGPLLQRMAERSVREDYARLKELLEH